MPTPLHRAARRATRALGVRGSGLLLIAVIWTLLAVGILTNPDPHTAQPGTFHGLIHPSVLAAGWLTAAGLALTGSLDRRFGSHRDGLALGVATIPPMFYATSYVWAWVVELIPGPPPGFPRGWLSASIYLALVALVWLVASIPDEVPEPPAPTP